MTLFDPSVLRFPAICLALDGSVSVCRSAEDLCQCNAYAYWRNDYYRDLRIFDSHCAPYRVLEFETIRHYSSLGRFLARLGNQRLTARLGLISDGMPAFETVKRQVALWLDRAPELWESSDDLDAWKARILGCASMENLIRCLE